MTVPPIGEQVEEYAKALLGQEVTIDEIRCIRDYFGVHDKTVFEHHAYDVMDRLYKQMK